MLGSGRRSLRAALSLAFTRAPFASRLHLASSTLTTPWIYFYISSFLHLSLPLSFFFLVPRDRILSVRLKTVDTYRSILFTTPSILRDVGVPISALLFPLFTIPCLRIHIPPSCFMRPSYLLIHFRCLLSLCRLDIVIARHYCQKFSIFFHDVVPFITSV